MLNHAPRDVKDMVHGSDHIFAMVTYFRERASHRGDRVHRFENQVT
jgi:hypothetical protein